MSIFKGAGVAIVTPMKDNLEVNYDKLEELIEYQIDQGTDSIIIAGTTGESSTLSVEEHLQVIKAAIEFTKGRIPVVAGTGSNCTQTAIQLSKEAEEAGADEDAAPPHPARAAAIAAAMATETIFFIFLSSQIRQQPWQAYPLFGAGVPLYCRFNALKYSTL